MSKLTDQRCECGAKLRITLSKGSSGEVGKNKKMKLPGVGRAGHNYWYCTKCFNHDHLHPDDTPTWIEDFGDTE